MIHVASWLKNRRSNLDKTVKQTLGIPTNERVVAWGTSRSEATVVATSAALYGVGERLPWYRIARATWQEPFLEITTTDAPPQKIKVHLTDERDLPYAIHACVTESVIVSERLELDENLGAIAAARRTEDGGVSWSVVFDPGIDPSDPQIRAAAEAKLADLRSALGI